MADDPEHKTEINTVNRQIVDAVKTSTDYVFGLKPTLNSNTDKNRLSTGAAIAFDKAAQAASLSVQDASDYVRNVMAISATAQGKALAEILAEQNVDNATTAMTLAQTSVATAIESFGALSTSVTTLLSDFPRG